MENDEFEEELIQTSHEFFDKEIWNSHTKEEAKGLSKREFAKMMFSLGFMVGQKFIDEQIKDMEEKIKEHPEIFKEAIKKLGIK